MSIALRGSTTDGMEAIESTSLVFLSLLLVKSKHSTLILLLIGHRKVTKIGNRIVARRKREGAESVALHLGCLIPCFRVPPSLLTGRGRKQGDETRTLLRVPEHHFAAPAHERRGTLSVGRAPRLQPRLDVVGARQHSHNVTLCELRQGKLGDKEQTDNKNININITKTEA
jgi:hypothetical protein